MSGFSRCCGSHLAIFHLYLHSRENTKRKEEGVFDVDGDDDSDRDILPGLVSELAVR